MIKLKKSVDVKAGEGIGRITQYYVWYKDELVQAPHIHFGIWDSESAPPLNKVGYGEVRSFTNPIKFLQENKPMQKGKDP